MIDVDFGAPAPAMTFARAKAFILPFGRHKGERVDEVAGTDDGLLYLDWLVSFEGTRGDLEDALVTYLDDPSIKREMEQLMGR